MTESNNIKAKFVSQSQAQKEVTINDAIAALDALQNRGAEDKDISTPPGSPAEGEVYIVGGSPTGAWDGKEKQIAYFSTGWKFITPNEGLTIWVNDEDKMYSFDGADWVASSISTNNIPLVGVNATADSTNKLSVASDAVLFSHNGTDSRVKANKNAVGDTASHLFQTGFSGRAEFGLIGNDDFTLKTSPDGSGWNNAMVASKTDGVVDFPAGIKFAGGSLVLDRYETGTWTPVLQGNGTPGTNSYTNQVGRYTRIGNMVYVSCRLDVSGAVDSSMSGQMMVSGLPFTAKSGSADTAGLNLNHYANMNLSSGSILNLSVLTNTSTVVLREVNNTGATVITSTGKFGSSPSIRFTGFYECA